MKKILLILFLLPFLGLAQVDLVQWNGSTDLVPTILNNNIVASNVTGAGITGPTPGYDGITGTGWPTGNAIDTGKYFQITLNPILDGAVVLNEIRFTYKGTYNSFQVRYSKAADFSSPTTLTTVTNAASNNSPTVVSLTNPITVNAGEKIYIRFYAYNGGGSWKLMDGNLLKLRGTVTTPSRMIGDYVIGNASGASFPTISSALKALMDVGARGDVRFLLDNILYNTSTNETFPIVISPYVGNDLYKVTFKPNTGKTVTIAASNNTINNNNNTVTSVFKLNGVDRVVFDGSNSENGTSKDLTLDNTNSSNNSRTVIWIASENSTNGSNNNEIKNVIIRQHTKYNGSQDRSMGIFAGGTSDVISQAEAANSNITVSNVEFKKVGLAIYVNGNNDNSKLSSNWVVKNNIIGNDSSDNSLKPYCGVDFSNVKDYEVSNNDIKGIVNDINQSFSGRHAAIWITGNSNGSIFNNKIANLSNSLGNGTPQSRGIYINSSNNLIYNNFISNVYSSVGPGGNGVYINSGSANKIYYNTIVMNNNSNPSGSSCLYINGGSVLEIKNNIFYNTQTIGSQYAVYSRVANSAFTAIDYNDYYAATIGYLGSARTTLANWRTATGKDVQSIDILPVFVSSTDLHLSNGENSKLKAATPISGITTDIDGDTRDITTPYIGADEIKCTFLTKWNGESWFPGAPSIDSKVVFVENYNENEDETKLDENRELIEACSCEVTASFKVVIKKGRTLKVVNEVKVATGAELIFENNASLVQVNEDPNINSGNIIYKRETGILNRYDFTYWSSPVAGMTLGILSPTTFFDKYFSYMNVNAWALESRATDMKEGVGYSVRAPQSYKTTGSIEIYKATFTGVPHNGLVTLTSLAGSQAHLLGNPYPSAIDADVFLNLNSDLNVPEEQRVLEGTLYFWTHNSPPSDAIPGDKKYNYTTADYATYNRTGGVGNGPKALAASTGGTPPTGNIAAGQGFFAPTKAGGNVVFKNTMRISGGASGTDNAQFFKLSTNSKTTTTVAKTEKNRIWLNLTNNEGAFKQTLIGYITGATNNYDGGFDGMTYDGNQYVDFYSVNNEVNLAIQGRALPFVKKDSVALGYKSTIKGEFQISIDQTDGVLTTQNVFLEDKDLKVVHDLKKEAYTFSTEKGAFNNRFVLRYADKNAVDEVIVPETPGQESNAAVIVSVKDGEIKINATTTKLDKVVVYDMAGRKLFQKNKVDANVFFISRLVWNHQALVVDIVLTDGTKHSRKIIN
ncbi:hypothetical protein AAGV33_02350 [Flavobacterium sp. FBOR7N2.3]|uniref:Right handed beta helix domain-containing protein n=1 Tax=Flavobacterium magnesitis TaxID=3138077 RepID=A0ABV4TJV2_9FLAO